MSLNDREMNEFRMVFGERLRGALMQIGPVNPCRDPMFYFSPENPLVEKDD